MKLPRKLLRDQSGQAAYELGLLAGFVALSLQPALQRVEQFLHDRFELVAAAQTGAATVQMSSTDQPVNDAAEASATASTDERRDRQHRVAGPKASENYWPRTTSFTF